MAKPTHDQIKAVRKALYKRSRMQRLSDLMHNLAVSMNLNPSADLPTGDVRYPPGSGPQWFFPDTGAVDNLVIQSAGYPTRSPRRSSRCAPTSSRSTFPKRTNRTCRRH